MNQRIKMIKKPYPMKTLRMQVDELKSGGYIAYVSTGEEIPYAEKDVTIEEALGALGKELDKASKTEIAMVHKAQDDYHVTEAKEVSPEG